MGCQLRRDGGVGGKGVGGGIRESERRKKDGMARRRIIVGSG